MSCEEEVTIHSGLVEFSERSRGLDLDWFLEIRC